MSWLSTITLSKGLIAYFFIMRVAILYYKKYHHQEVALLTLKQRLRDNTWPLSHAAGATFFKIEAYFSPEMFCKTLKSCVGLETFFYSEYFFPSFFLQKPEFFVNGANVTRFWKKTFFSTIINSFVDGESEENPAGTQRSYSLQLFISLCLSTSLYVSHTDYYTVCMSVYYTHYLSQALYHA